MNWLKKLVLGWNHCFLNGHSWLYIRKYTHRPTEKEKKHKELKKKGKEKEKKGKTGGQGRKKEKKRKRTKKKLRKNGKKRGKGEEKWRGGQRGKKKRGGGLVQAVRGAWVLRGIGPHTNNARSKWMFFSFPSSAKGQTTQITPPTIWS